MKRKLLLNRVRAATAGFAALAFLVYMNTVQLEDQSEDTLRAAGAATTSLTRVLAERQAASVHNAVTEYVALVSVVFGVTLAVGAPRLVRARVP